MAQRFRIIDGYNLMHSVGYAQERFGPGGLEKSRNRLLRFIANRLDPEERRRTTIVFDARTIPVEGSRETRFEDMTVLFNQPGSDADTLIEELILKHSAPRQLEVVSGDRRLQKAIRRRKGIAVESDRFAGMLRMRESIAPGSELDQKRHSEDAEAAERDRKPTEDETAEWLEIFGTDAGDVPVDHSTRKGTTLRPGDESWDKHIQDLMDDLNGGTFDTDGDRPRRS